MAFIIDGTNGETFPDSTTQATAFTSTPTVTTLTTTNLKAPSGVLASQNGMAGIPKAWCNYNAQTGTIVGSFNISSVTLSSTGVQQFNFTTAMPSATYAVATSGSAEYTPTSAALFSGSNATCVNYVDAAQTTSSFTVRTGYSYAGGGSTPRNWYFLGVIVCGS